MRAILTHSFLVLSVITWGGCASQSLDLETAEGLYQSGLEDVKKERFVQGIEKLRKVQSKHPYSKFATLARITLADAYFEQASYEEAAAAYEVFRDLHPKHEKAEYAQFRIGEAFQNAAPSHVARDQSLLQQALAAYEAFLFEYPKGTFAPKAREQMRLVREKLAAKELYIARFYRRTGASQSALGRLKKLELEYGETDVAQEAKKELSKIDTPSSAPQGGP